MNLDIRILGKNNYFLEFIKKEMVLVIAISLAIISSLFNIPKFEYIDFKVLILLFNLMIVVSSFNNLKVLDAIAVSMLKKCTIIGNKYFKFNMISLFNITLMLDRKEENNSQKMERETNKPDTWYRLEYCDSYSFGGLSKNL